MIFVTSFLIMTIFYDYTAGRGKYDDGYEIEYVTDQKSSANTNKNYKYSNDKQGISKSNDKFHFSYGELAKERNENIENNSTKSNKFYYKNKTQNYNQKQSKYGTNKFSYNKNSTKPNKYRSNRSPFYSQNNQPVTFTIGSKYQRTCDQE